MLATNTNLYLPFNASRVESVSGYNFDNNLFLFHKPINFSKIKSLGTTWNSSQTLVKPSFNESYLPTMKTLSNLITKSLNGASILRIYLACFNGLGKTPFSINVPCKSNIIALTIITQPHEYTMKIRLCF